MLQEKKDARHLIGGRQSSLLAEARASVPIVIDKSSLHLRVFDNFFFTLTSR